MQVIVEADGGSRGNPGPAGYGAVVMAPDDRTVLAERRESIGRATNNVAEYRGLIAGLSAAAELGASAVAVRMDSKLVVEQMSGRWQVKHPDMRPLARQAQELRRHFEVVTFQWIPREQNKHADRLANEAMDAAARLGTGASTPPAGGPAGRAPDGQLSIDADALSSASASPPTDATVLLRLAPDLRARARSVADRRGVTVADLARQGLEQLLAAAQDAPAVGTAP